MSKTLGYLILISGPSGAGKDTLIQNYLNTNPNATTPIRHITRNSQIGEESISLSEADFLANEANGKYCLSWYANGLYYGIPQSMLDELKNGKDVLLNLSRGKISDAKALWQQHIHCHLVISNEVLRERLINRGREDSASIEKRLQRNSDYANPEGAHFIDAEQSPDNCLTQLIEIVSGYK